MNSILFFICLVPILGLIFFNLNFFLAPHKPYKEKKTPFECGYHSFTTQNRIQFTISFFIFALLFLMFDIELSIVYPVLVSSYIVDGYGISTVVVFILILTLGFVFELGKNALKIESKQDNFYLENQFFFDTDLLLFLFKYMTDYSGNYSCEDLSPYLFKGIQFYFGIYTYKNILPYLLKGIQYYYGIYSYKDFLPYLIKLIQIYLTSSLVDYILLFDKCFARINNIFINYLLINCNHVILAHELFFMYLSYCFLYNNGLYLPYVFYAGICIIIAEILNVAYYLLNNLPTNNIIIIFIRNNKQVNLAINITLGIFTLVAVVLVLYFLFISVVQILTNIVHIRGKKSKTSSSTGDNGANPSEGNSGGGSGGGPDNGPGNNGPGNNGPGNGGDDYPYFGDHPSSRKRRKRLPNDFEDSDVETEESRLGRLKKRVYNDKYVSDHKQETADYQSKYYRDHIDIRNQDSKDYKEFRREYYHEEDSAYYRNYRKKNSEHIKENDAQYRKDHDEEIKAKAKVYRDENRDEIRKRDNEYQQQPEVKKKKSDQQKERMKDPEKKEKNRKQQKAFKDKPENKARKNFLAREKRRIQKEEREREKESNNN